LIKKKLPDNERLEFLGDAVLDLIIAEILFVKFPYQGEGFLTEMRSKMVSRDKLGKLSNKMGLVSLIEYDRQITLRPMQLDTMGGNALEALIGAIYLDKGYKKVSKFVRDRIVEAHFDFRELQDSEISYKAKLIEWAQKSKAKLYFKLEKEFKKGKNIYYEIQLVIDEKVIASDTNFSKKKAEELAAEKGWKLMFPDSDV
jgi:ribonuclease-3